MIEITQDEVETVAGLAQLTLTSKEKEMFRGNMQDVLGYFDTLAQVETDDVPEIGHITGMQDVYRDDEVTNISEEARNAIMQNVPTKDGDYIEVKNVL